MTTHICDLTPSDADPESARDLLYRHALPEDVIDGVLCLHAQELATVQRREAAVWGVDTAAGKHILGAADLIDPTRTQPAAPEAVPPTDRAAALTEAERTMLTYALDQAQEKIWSEDGFTDEDQAAAVDTFLASLTDYERGLVHDTAVMGYVQGLMRDRSEGVPKDSQVMALVVDACLAMPDKYPTVNGAFEERSTTVEYFVQCQQPDESWEQASSTNADAEAAVEQREAQRRARPDFEFRLARRTTRVIVEAERTPEEPKP